MQSPAPQRRVPDELAASGDFREVQQMIAADNPRSDAENVAPHSEAPEKRLNPLWAVNGALAAFLFAAAMYLASR
jgi:hypothetical protein